MVYSLDKVIHATNPHLKGRLIPVVEISEETGFKIMKRIKTVVYYFNNETKKKTPCLTVQEVLRIPEAQKDKMMDEYGKRFLPALFMWTSSQLYNDIVNGRLDVQPSSEQS